MKGWFSGKKISATEKGISEKKLILIYVIRRISMMELTDVNIAGSNAMSQK